MVGGVILQIKGIEPGRAWVNVGGIDGEYRETCAIYLDPAGETLLPGDSLWWQAGHAMWTPRDRSRVDVKLKKIGCSGVSFPKDEAPTPPPLEDPAPKQRVTLSGRPPETNEPIGAPAEIDPATGMHKDYWVLPEEERKKGFVRPYRDTYVHDTCGVATKMGRALSETYARSPSYYGSTFCCGCKTHFPVGQFKWDDGNVVGS